MQDETNIQMSSIDKKPNSTTSVTISAGITFASDNYLIPQGSLILQTAAVLGTSGSLSETSTGLLFQNFY